MLRLRLDLRLPRQHRSRTALPNTRKPPKQRLCQPVACGHRHLQPIAPFFARCARQPIGYRPALVSGTAGRRAPPCPVQSPRSAHIHSYRHIHPAPSPTARGRAPSALNGRYNRASSSLLLFSHLAQSFHYARRDIAEKMTGVAIDHRRFAFVPHHSYSAE